MWFNNFFLVKTDSEISVKQALLLLPADACGPQHWPVPRTVLPTWPCKSVHFSSSLVRASAAPQGRRWGFPWELRCCFLWSSPSVACSHVATTGTSSAPSFGLGILPCSKRVSIPWSLSGHHQAKQLLITSWRKWGKSVVCLLLCPGTRSPNSLRGPGHTSCVCLKQRRLKLRWKPNVRVMRPFVSVHQYMKAHLAVSDLWLVDWVYICMVIDCYLNIGSCAAIQGSGWDRWLLLLFVVRVWKDDLF